MSDTEQAELKPLTWTAEEIEDAVKEVAHNDMPDMDNQSVTVFRAEQLMRRVRNDFQARIERLTAELEAAKAGQGWGTPDNLRLCQAAQQQPDVPQADWANAPDWADFWARDSNGKAHWYEYEPSWIDLDGEWMLPVKWNVQVDDSLDGFATLQRRPRRELQRPAMPKPDWGAAPSWSNWWAVDPNGWAHWFQEEPVLCLTITYSGWVAKTIQGIQQGGELWAAELDLELGIDWRTLKKKRPRREGE